MTSDNLIQSPLLNARLHGDPDFERAIIDVLNMHRLKGADYGHDGDFYANVAQSATWGVPPWIGAMIRLNDKVVRLQNFSKTGILRNEGVEDSLYDIASYAIIALILYRRGLPVLDLGELDI